jgi:hypothetical protein
MISEYPGNPCQPRKRRDWPEEREREREGVGDESWIDARRRNRYVLREGSLLGILKNFFFRRVLGVSFLPLSNPNASPTIAAGLMDVYCTRKEPISDGSQSP